MSEPLDIIDLLDGEYPHPKINGNNQHIRNMLAAVRKLIEIDGDAGESSGLIITRASSSSSNTAYIRQRSSRGTVAARLPLLDNYIVGRMIFEGYDNNSFDSAGQILFRATQDWNATNHGTEASVLVVPDNSVVEVEGLLIAAEGIRPRMLTTTERNAIVAPPEGLLFYNTTNHRYEFWNGTAWRYMTDGAA